jgi:EAL domain-containing protein (putative c-di-GMP-specific phosphodiesterase class I)
MESSDEIKFLREHYSDIIDGYYFMPPLDEKHCTKFLESNLGNA